MEIKFTIKQMLACAGLVCLFAACSTDDVDSLAPNATSKTNVLGTKNPNYSDDEIGSMYMGGKKDPNYSDDEIGSMYMATKKDPNYSDDEIGSMVHGAN